MGTGPEVWATIERISFVWIKDRYVPYPFQNNLSVLDTEDQIACLEGKTLAHRRSPLPAREITPPPRPRSPPLARLLRIDRCQLPRVPRSLCSAQQL